MNCSNKKSAGVESMYLDDDLVKKISMEDANKTSASKPFIHLNGIKILNNDLLKAFKETSTETLSKNEETKSLIDIINEEDESTIILTKIKTPTPIALEQKTTSVFIPNISLDLY